MSSFLRNKKLLATLTTLTAASGYYYYSKNRDSCYYNQKWVNIGKVSGLYIYPIKSCSHIEVDSFKVTKMGASRDTLSDRVFMIVNENMELCTARSFPKMVLVIPTVDENNMLTLSAPNVDDFKIDLNDLASHSKDDKNLKKSAKIWESTVEVIDLGEEISEWITKVCGNTDDGKKLKIVYYLSDAKCVRQLREKHKGYKDMTPNHIGALQDATSFMLLNEGSLQDLNTKLEKPVKPTQFRPNILVSTTKPYDEDNWKFIKIGEKTIMKNLKPCTRGTFSAVDQQTGEHDKNGEPLKTLNNYRKIDGLPVMGINAGVIKTGDVKIGDEVYVSYKNNSQDSANPESDKFSSYIFLKSNDKK